MTDIQKETERIHQGIVESLSFSEALAKKEAEIERLRKSLDDHLDSEAAETRRADREREKRREAESKFEQALVEIERLREEVKLLNSFRPDAELARLRGLLREAHLTLSFMPDPTRKLLDLRYRVREALGE